jgi:hypothetical protein
MSRPIIFRILEECLRSNIISARARRGTLGRVPVIAYVISELVSKKHQSPYDKIARTVVVLRRVDL